MTAADRTLPAALRAVAAVAVLALLPGCAWMSSLNPFGGDDEELGPAPLIDLDPEVRLREQWDAAVGGGTGARYNRLVPAVAGDLVVAADAYGVVEARRLEDGERLWQTRIGTPEGGFLSALVFWGRDDDGGSFVTGGVGADRDAAFVGTENGELVALRLSDGGELWRAQLSSEVLAPAASDGEHVLVATLDGRLAALSRSDASRLWSYDTQVPVLTLRGTAGPVISDPLAFMGFANGRLTALRVDSGQVVWEHVVSLPTGRSELERMADVDNAPLVGPNGAYVASYQGAIKSLRLADGQVQWERPLSSHGGLAEGYGQVYATAEDGTLRAFDSVSGNVVWEQDALARRGVTGPAVFGPWVAVGDAEGYVHVFAQSDGRPVGRVRVDSDGIRSAPTGVGDRLLVYGNDGRLAVYRAERTD
jgi:outer membrane protein assembly factor BamB